MSACVPITFLACSTYTPAPLEPYDLLNKSRQQPALPSADLLDPMAATAFALSHNHELKVVRHSVDIAESVLVEAGTWPDINLGWGAMDWLVGGTSDDAISGASLSVPLFAPDERDALLADARASRDIVKARLVDAEWRLGRLVALEYLELAASQERLKLAGEAYLLADETLSYLLDGLELGAATQFDVEMAILQGGRALPELKKAQRHEATTRLKLNYLLGAKPDARYATLPITELDDYWPTTSAEDPAALTDLALANRPEVIASKAQYQIAEAALRLETSRQWPGVELGTGIGLRVPLFNGFNKHAIETARLRREQAALQFEATVNKVRADAWSVFEQASGYEDEWQSYRDGIAPSLEASLRLAKQARSLGALTHLEVLFSQHQLNQTRSEGIEILAAHLSAKAELAWFAGMTVTPEPIDR